MFRAIEFLVEIFLPAISYRHVLNKLCEFHEQRISGLRGVNYHPAIGEFPLILTPRQRCSLALRIRWWMLWHRPRAQEWRLHLERDGRYRVRELGVYAAKSVHTLIASN